MVAVLFLLVAAVLHLVDSDDPSWLTFLRSKHNYETCNEPNFKKCFTTQCDYQEEKYVICYFTSWAWYRDGVKYKPENIDPSLCTHIFYAFASLDKNSLTITPADPTSDLEKNFYKDITDLQKKGVTIMLSLAGWTDSAGTKWSQLYSDDSARDNFVKTTVKYLKKYNFQGLDLDVEYPACPQGNRTIGHPSDKGNFNKLLGELKKAFNKKYLLTVTTAGGKSLIDDCYNMRGICPLVDWINVMTYEYHSHYDGVVGANAPMCGTKENWGVIDTVKYYLEVIKCPANQIVLGIPFYGQTYTMKKAKPAKFGVAAQGPGKPGKYTNAPGTIAYYESCLLLREGDWTIGYNRLNGSFASKGKQFISLASEIDIVSKVCLIKNYKLKGAMFWALDYDDFNNLCGCGEYPLLKTLNQQLRCMKFPPIFCY